MKIFRKNWLVLYLFQTFSNAQSILVLITAMSAFVTVAFNKRITFGKYDWVLLLATIGIPATVSSVMAALDWLGPSGFWWVSLLFIVQMYPSINVREKVSNAWALNGKIIAEIPIFSWFQSMVAFLSVSWCNSMELLKKCVSQVLCVHVRYLEDHEMKDLAVLRRPLWKPKLIKFQRVVIFVFRKYNWWENP